VGNIKLITLGYLLLLGYLLSAGAETNNWLGPPSRTLPYAYTGALPPANAGISIRLPYGGGEGVAKARGGGEPQLSELFLISQNTNNKTCPDPVPSPYYERGRKLVLAKGNPVREPVREPLREPVRERGDGEIIKIFKQKCKELFKLNKSHNIIILDLAKLINQTLLTASGSNSYRLKRFMKNFIHKRS
jgi:hypothetical protein